MRRHAESGRRFPRAVTEGRRDETDSLSDQSPVAVQIRAHMDDGVFEHLRAEGTKSNNNDNNRSARIAWAMPFANFIIGTTTEDGEFHDILRHTADQEQTTTYCSSVDPWHQPSDLGSTKQAQMGFDLFFTSGVTRGLPAMVPVAMLYDTPDNAAAEIAYLKARGYPISYVEMGEEADGQYMLPEDYAALYLQWATAIHRVDPALKLGGPSFQGVNKDIEVWPDANGKVSWTGRFLDYLKQHGRHEGSGVFFVRALSLRSVQDPVGQLYDEPELVSHIMQVWREDGVPARHADVYHGGKSLVGRERNFSGYCSPGSGSRTTSDRF